MQQSLPFLFSSNQLTELPEELCNLKSLKVTECVSSQRKLFVMWSGMSILQGKPVESGWLVNVYEKWGIC